MGLKCVDVNVLVEYIYSSIVLCSAFMYSCVLLCKSEQPIILCTAGHHDAGVHGFGCVGNVTKQDVKPPLPPLPGAPLWPRRGPQTLGQDAGRTAGRGCQQQLVWSQ